MRLANAGRMSDTEQLTTQLDRLASIEAGPFPVISLYLNLQPNEHGRALEPVGGVGAFLRFRV